MIKLKLVAAIAGALALASSVHAQNLLAAWDFTGQPGTQATQAATVFSSGFDSSNLLTRGAGAAGSAGSNSFRTVGFQNNGIATSNTDYFQLTLSSAPGNTFSLSGITIRTNGTASFDVAPGVSQQWAYSLDGTNFTLIGAPVAVTGGGQQSVFDFSGTPALQGIADTTTVTLRYYASGQTSTGGWGFFSSAAGDSGLSVFGSGITPVVLVPEPATYMLMGLGVLICAQKFRRRKS